MNADVTVVHAQRMDVIERQHRHRTVATELLDLACDRLAEIAREIRGHDHEQAVKIQDALWLLAIVRGEIDQLV